MPSLFDILDSGLARRPSAALHFVEQRETTSFLELRRAALGVAAQLHAEGLTPGDAVGVLSQTGADFYAALFGVAAAGMTVVTLPLPSGLAELETYQQRLKSLINAVGLRALLVDETFAAAASMLSTQAPGLRVVRVSALRNSSGWAAPFERPVSPRASTLALIQFTSGSTATPRGVGLAAQQLLSGVRAITAGAQMTRDDVLASWLPLYHDMGLFGSLASISEGIEQFHWSPRSFVRNPGGWLRDFARRRATLYAGPNFSYERMLSGTSPEERDELDLSAWRVAFNGAEPVDGELLEQFATFFARAGLRRQTLFPVYGLAEATLAVCFPPYGAEPVVERVERDALASGHAAVAKSGAESSVACVSVGRAVLDHSISIRREDGTEAQEREVGELWVKGPAIMRGYVGSPNAEQPFCGPWLRTGDLAYIADGLVFIVGRRKEMIIVAGKNYYPQDAEAVVRGHPAVYRGRCAAVALPDETIGIVAETRLTAVPELDAVRRELRGRVATLLGVNRLRIELVSPGTIQRTTSGKLKRTQLRDALSAGGSISHSGAQQRRQGHADV